MSSGRRPYRSTRIPVLASQVLSSSLNTEMCIHHMINAPIVSKATSVTTNNTSLNISNQSPCNAKTNDLSKDGPKKAKIPRKTTT